MVQPLLLVANPYAGGGRIGEVLPVVTRVLRSRGVTYAVEEAAGFAALAAAAERASRSGFAAVVAVGGDGTVNAVVNGVMRAGGRTAVGIVPAGTANEFARGLPIPRSAQRAAQALAHAQPAAFDVAEVNGRFFANVFGLGFDARVAAGANRLRDRRFLRGRAVYFLASLLELVSGREPLEVEVVTESERFSGRVLLVAVVNGRMYGERVPSLPTPSLRDGLLDLYIIQEMRRMRSLNAALKMLRRSPIPEIVIQRCRQVTVEADRPVETHVDGNPMDASRRIHARVLPRALQILLPPEALPWKPSPLGHAAGEEPAPAFPSGRGDALP
ncbi:MAG: diacylglycerol kinase family lipid kinase [Armatimonadota bacterium]|nr:diacylglycerol kinase family lipid kinase [Armatimonadota bacterium]MDW8156114.1 diacylglycerol kinase family lipid kinase [Armatimonadota bacterium]